MTYDLNQNVEITLTKLGQQIIIAEREKLKLIWPKNDWSIHKNWNEQNKVKWQLWEVFELFGEHISLGGSLPFETEITLLDEVKE